MTGLLRLLVLTILVVWPAVAEAAADRLAIVIGNGAYRNGAPLPNARRDAEAVAAALRRLGYRVVDGYDLDHAGMGRLMQQAEDAIRTEGPATVLTFYAGHGLQIGGRNYLLPTDFALTRLQDVEGTALSLDQVLERTGGARALRVAILDACRDNPFAAEVARLLGLRGVPTRGMARVTRGNDMLVAFATEANAVAADGTGRHSPYTAALLEHIENPELELRVLFDRVRDSVQAATGGRQKPFVYASLGTTSHWLARPAGAGAVAPAPASASPVAAPRPAATPAPTPAVAAVPAAPGGAPVRRALMVGFRDIADTAAIRQRIEKDIPKALVGFVASPDEADVLFVGGSDDTLRLTLQNAALAEASRQRAFSRRAVAVAAPAAGSGAPRPGREAPAAVGDLVKSLRVIAENSDLLLLGRAAGGFRLALSTGDGRVRFSDGEQLSYTVESGQDAHLLLIAASSDGSVNVLLPNQTTRAARVGANGRLRLPTGEESFYVTAPFGTDLIKAIAFTSKPPFLDELVPRNGPYTALSRSQAKALVARIAAWMDANPGRFAESVIFIETTAR
ncbi:DUF4384 domain-containing protein [Azospirillum sp. RWY-5-1]|nr:DUF4384 domain-containing protein [Azospirillum oleiclasticum]